MVVLRWVAKTLWCWDAVLICGDVGLIRWLSCAVLLCCCLNLLNSCCRRLLFEQGNGDLPFTFNPVRPRSSDRLSSAVICNSQCSAEVLEIVDDSLEMPTTRLE